MELLQTLRKIRACESEVAAQLLLEAYVAQEVAAERERCANSVRKAGVKASQLGKEQAVDVAWEILTEIECAEAIRPQRERT